MATHLEDPKTFQRAYQLGWLIVLSGRLKLGKLPEPESNRCHRFRGFVYQQAHFSADKKSIEVAVRPRKGSVVICPRCHLPAPGYDQLGERRFEFIPLWGFLVFLLYTMRRVDCRRCGVVTVEEVPWGDGKRTFSTGN